MRFYLDVGRIEDGGGLRGGCSENRCFRHVLKAKGYAVHYCEFNGGHDYVSWRGSFADGLMTLAGTGGRE